MEHKINVLGIDIDNYSADEAMQLVGSYFENDVMNVIKVIYSDVLVAAGENEMLKQAIEDAHLTIIGDKAILNAAEISEGERAAEVENGKFLSLFLQYIGSRNKKVYLLTEKEAFNEELIAYISKYYEEVNIIGMSALENSVADDDTIVNDINGADSEILLSSLAAPLEEEFLLKNKLKLNVKVWLGIGGFEKSGYGLNSKSRLLKRLIEHGIFKRHVTKFKNKEENMEDTSK